MSTIKNIVFDLGGVLIDWNPRYLYQKLFNSTEEIEYFLNHICTSDWNEQQDAGRSLADGTQILIDQHPDWEAPIRAFYDRWEEMLGGVIPETEELLNSLLQSGNYRMLALTNWSAETFPIAWERYHCLHRFEDILVSGKEHLKKPDPRIYQLLFQRFELNPAQCLFIDDNLNNINAAQKLGMHTHHFDQPAGLSQYLKSNNLL